MSHWTRLLACLFVMCSVAQADTIVLRNGRVLKNCLVEITGDVVRVTHNGVVLRFHRDEIASHEKFATLPDRAAVAPTTRKRIGLSGSRVTAPRVEQVPAEAGSVQRRELQGVAYYEYIPRLLRKPVTALFLFHGTPGDTPAEEIASDMVSQVEWIHLAEEQGVILVAPAFDDERFELSRYLLGYGVRPDQWVLDVFGAYRVQFPSAASQFYLYGHSAGGQFVHRFALVHPDRVAGAVVSAAGSYAFPDAGKPWPFGLSGAPNAEGFVAASTIPTTVLVGTNDTEPLDLTEYQPGETRVQRAEAWVRSMRELARKNNKDPAVRLVRVENLNHTTWMLSGEAALYLFQ